MQVAENLGTGKPGNGKTSGQTGLTPFLLSQAGKSLLPTGMSATSLVYPHSPAAGEPGVHRSTRTINSALTHTTQARPPTKQYAHSQSVSNCLCALELKIGASSVCPRIPRPRISPDIVESEPGHTERNDSLPPVRMWRTMSL